MTQYHENKSLTIFLLNSEKDVAAPRFSGDKGFLEILAVKNKHLFQNQCLTTFLESVMPFDQGVHQQSPFSETFPHKLSMG